MIIGWACEFATLCIKQSNVSAWHAYLLQGNRHRACCCNASEHVQVTKGFAVASCTPSCTVQCTAFAKTGNGWLHGRAGIAVRSLMQAAKFLFHDQSSARPDEGEKSCAHIGPIAPHALDLMCKTCAPNHPGQPVSALCLAVSLSRAGLWVLVDVYADCHCKVEVQAPIV